MRVEQLYYFMETAKIGSINAAANKLHISQQSLNTTLKNLEREFNQPLFLTSSKGIVLTKQGELVAEAAHDVTTRLNLLKTNLENTASNSGEASLSIRATYATIEGFLSDAVAHFTSENPNIHVNLQLGNHVQIIESLTNGSIDLGILGIRQNNLDNMLQDLHDKNLDYFPLYQYKLNVIASRQLPIAQNKTISMKSVLKHPIILLVSTSLEDDSTYQWLKLFGEPNIASTTTSFSFYKKELQTGHVIGFYTNYVHCEVHLDVENDLKLIPIRGQDGAGSAGYLVNNARPLDSTAQLFINHSMISKAT